MLSSVLHTGLSGLKAGSAGDEAGAMLLHDDDSTENRLQAALEQTLLKNIQYKVVVGGGGGGGGGLVVAVVVVVVIVVVVVVVVV